MPGAAPTKAAIDVGPPDAPLNVVVRGGEFKGRVRHVLRHAVIEAFRHTSHVESASTGDASAAGAGEAATGAGSSSDDGGALPADGGADGEASAGSSSPAALPMDGDARRSNRHYRFVHIMKRVLASQFGPDFNIVIGQELSLHVRYRKKKYLRLTVQGQEADDPIFTVLLYQSIPDLDVADHMPVDVATYRGPQQLRSKKRGAAAGDAKGGEDGDGEASGAGAGAAGDEEADDILTTKPSTSLQVFHSTMSDKVQPVVLACIQRAHAECKGNWVTFNSRVKDLVTERFGSTWHCVHGLLSPGFCVSPTADPGCFIEVRVGKRHKLFLYRNSTAPLYEVMSTDTKRLVVYAMAIVSFIGYMYLQVKCDWSCAEDKPTAADCSEEQLAAAAVCERSSKMLMYLTVAVVLLAGGWRFANRVQTRPAASAAVVAGAAEANALARAAAPGAGAAIDEISKKRRSKKKTH